ncbi:MAG: acyltransferase domain-containing protein [Kiritimatiellae bacterium]|nr:acyltransferase domain-containing protein [Kiritimatiellia bacterium]
MSNALHLYDPFDSELILIGAPNDAALADEVKRVILFLEHVPDALLQDIAYTCVRTARQMPSVIAVVASSVPDLRDRLSLAHKKLAENAGRIRDKSGTYFFRDRLRPRGRIAFLFPGAVSFYPDMLRDLCLAFDDCRSAFDELEEALQTEETDRFSPADYIFPPSASYRIDAEAFSAHAFSESFIAIHAANTALFRLFDRIGVSPDGLAGISGGEFAALDVAGVYGDLTRNKRIVFMREGYQMLNRLVDRDDLPACIMLSVIDAPDDLIDSLIASHPGRMAVAFFHSPRQQSVALSPEILKEVTLALHAAGAKTMAVPVNRPFNTPWCSKALPPIKQFLAHWVRHMPKIPVYSCATGERLPAQPRGILNLTADQWTSPIRFDDTIRQMYADGFRIFIELGARGNMTNAIDETLKNQPHQAVAVNRIHRSGLAQLHHALGLLAAHGVQLDLTLLHRHRRQHVLDLDKPLSVTATNDHELRLSSNLPALTVFSPSGEFLLATRATGSTSRKTLPVSRDKRHLDFGADFPMLVNAEILSEEPGVLEIAKVVTLEDYPFLGDYALGTSQLSYADPNLKGLTLLSLISGLEIMSEAARKLVPRRRVAQIDNLRATRWVGFERGSVRLIIRAERIAWPDTQYAAVKVQLRDDSPNSAFTWPIIEATILLAATGTPPPPSNRRRPPAPPPSTGPATTSIPTASSTARACASCGTSTSGARKASTSKSRCLAAPPRSAQPASRFSPSGPCCWTASSPGSPSGARTKNSPGRSPCPSAPTASFFTPRVSPRARACAATCASHPSLRVRMWRTSRSPTATATC